MVNYFDNVSNASLVQLGCWRRGQRAVTQEEGAIVIPHSCGGQWDRARQTAAWCWRERDLHLSGFSDSEGAHSNCVHKVRG